MFSSCYCLLLPHPQETDMEIQEEGGKLLACSWPLKAKMPWKIHSIELSPATGCNLTKNSSKYFCEGNSHCCWPLCTYSNDKDFRLQSCQLSTFHQGVTNSQFKKTEIWCACSLIFLLPNFSSISETERGWNFSLTEVNQKPPYNKKRLLYP